MGGGAGGAGAGAGVGGGVSPDADSAPDADRERAVEIHLAGHASLDLVDKRARQGPSAAGAYLGLLGLVGRFATYALVGPTGMKAFAVADAESDPAPRDPEMRAILVALHAAYQDWTCNPFVAGGGSASGGWDAIEDDPVPRPEACGYAALVRRVARVGSMPVC